jgi:hypothetical protein
VKQHSFKVGDRVVVNDGVVVDEVAIVIGKRASGSYLVKREAGPKYVNWYGWDGSEPGTVRFVFNDAHMRLAPKKPTLADDISFKPSTRRILAHLKARGSITVLEALAAYGTARIAPAIHDLREGGYSIETVKKADAGGHNYTRYVLAA